MKNQGDSENNELVLDFLNGFRILLVSMVEVCC